MIVSHIKLKNWRNFRNVDVALSDRLFVVGPNASGKSNFLDAFRFLRDIAKQGGGLQAAVIERGGLSKIRCLAARQDPDVEIEIQLSNAPGEPPLWIYSLGIRQEVRGHRLPYLSYERVWRANKRLLNRPDRDDERDQPRQTQTHLEQINANSRFREIAKFFESVQYLHLVPQLLRHPRAFSGPDIMGDPFGKSFLNRIAMTPEHTRRSRLKKIEQALKQAVPQLELLSDVTDETGIPHLEAVYRHWRSKGAKQREDQFSDGTLRMIGLFWSLLEDDSLLLLEEPELSLHTSIVSKLPNLIHKMQRKKKRQIIITSHSAELFTDLSIGGNEVLLLKPSREGTEAVLADSITEIRTLLESGSSVADAVLPRTRPESIHQLTLNFLD